MEVSMDTSQFMLPEANQALKNVGQKSAKESESENISQNWVNQHFRLSP